MTQSQQLIEALSTTSRNGKARAQAYQQQDPFTPGSITSLISYRSAGRLLIIANQKETLQKAQHLSPGLQHTLLLNVDVKNTSLNSAQDEMLRGQVEAVKGYLGQFDVMLKDKDKDTAISLVDRVLQKKNHFDLVLDLTTPPFLQQDVLPPGYYAPGEDTAALQSAVAEMSELVGEFEKPKYFDYDPDICAHGRSGIQGCTRCLDACPTLAITSKGNTVNVDSFLCQGGGSCTAVCPTGAIRYVYPDMRYLLNRVRKTLQEYRLAGGEQPCLLFYAADDADALFSYVMQLPDSVFPIEIEELGALGMESWFSALAYGASHLVLWSQTPLAPAVLRETQTQLEYAASILEGMGYAANRLQLLDATPCEQLIDHLYALEQQADIFPASVTVFEDKRTNLRLTLDHLHRQAPQPRLFVSLPAGAPFGEVWVDQQTCTLCMACVSQCPTKALLAGDALPQLKFVEDNCIQCGLCARSCPENAIGPSPRYLYEASKRLLTRVIHEEQPFRCTVCGKPFATQKMVDKMAQKLGQHWMFKGKQDALLRLQMCEDCRVKDLYLHESNLDVHTKV